MTQLGTWAQRWFGTKFVEHELDAGVLMWDIRCTLDPNVLSDARTAVQFVFSDLSETSRNWWLVNQNGELDLCPVDRNPRRAGQRASVEAAKPGAHPLPRNGHGTDAPPGADRVCTSSGRRHMRAWCLASAHQVCKVSHEALRWCVMPLPSADRIQLRVRDGRNRDVFQGALLHSDGECAAAWVGLTPPADASGRIPPTASGVN
jgi:hypothetical protein